MEHTRWMWEKIRDGWRYGSPTDKPHMLHKCLLRWRLKDLMPYEGFAELGAEELSEEEKDVEWAVIRKIATILAHAGDTIAAARGKDQRVTAVAPK
jgi:hypothetical protein